MDEYTVMTTLQTYGKEIVALLVPIVGWALNYFFRARAELHMATPHAFAFLVQEPLMDAEGKEIQPSQNVYTRSVTIRNGGRVTATNVELVFNWKPMCINIWPSRHFREFTEPDNRFTIIFDSLSPKEQFGCHLLSVNRNLPELITVRSDQCVAKNIYMYPQPYIANWVRRLVAVLLFFGTASAIYLFIILLQLLILRTPLGH